MGWFGGTPSKVSAVQEVPPPQLLEDLQPKFEDSEPVHTARPSYADAIQQISLSSFSVDKYVAMPCFREAMLTGFQAMAVLGAVTFLIHKNPGRLANWGICGFFLGNVVGWEQCRLIRRRSFHTVEAARQANQDKMRRKVEASQATDEPLRKWEETQGKL